MLTNEEEHNVVSGCCKGDRKAQELLYRSYYKAMITLCLRYTKQDDDAVDVLNTGFFKVFKHIQQFKKEEASLYTWIRKIILNCCLDFVKAKQQQDVIRDLSEASDVYLQPEALSKLHATELLQAIRTLPAATQAVFNLYAMEGYNHREIAGMMAISEGTSKWHLSEARKILKRSLYIHEIFE